MGREIRKVPRNWKHPKDKDGEFISLYDETYKEVADKYLEDILQWKDGSHPSLTQNPDLKKKYPYFWDYGGHPPSEEFYRPEFDEPADCFQVYETVSEGTPKSPVFSSESDLALWLLGQGYSEEAVVKFIEIGVAPTFLTNSGRLFENIESTPYL